MRFWLNLYFIQFFQCILKLFYFIKHEHFNTLKTFKHFSVIINIQIFAAGLSTFSMQRFFMDRKQIHLSVDSASLVPSQADDAVSLVLPQADDAASLVLSQADAVVSLVLSQADAVLSLVVSQADDAVFLESILTVVIVSILYSG